MTEILNEYCIIFGFEFKQNSLSMVTKQYYCYHFNFGIVSLSFCRSIGWLCQIFRTRAFTIRFVHSLAHLSLSSVFLSWRYFIFDIAEFQPFLSQTRFSVTDIMKFRWSAIGNRIRVIFSEKEFKFNQHNDSMAWGNVCQPKSLPIEDFNGYFAHILYTQLHTSHCWMEYMFFLTLGPLIRHFGI